MVITAVAVMTTAAVITAAIVINAIVVIIKNAALCVIKKNAGL
jgi:hypothetical protein